MPRQDESRAVDATATDGVAHRRIINSWAMYDWANSAFPTTIMVAVFPLFFRSMAVEAGLGDADASAAWAYTAALALLIIALLGPLLGTISDYTGGKKRFIAFFAGMGIAASGLLVFLGDDDYVMGSVLFIIGNVGFAGANIFYESLLPHIAGRDDMDQISTRGYALGYVGGGTLLVINLLWVTRPEWFFMPGLGFALRATFLSVAVWWALFSIPLFRNVPEPPVIRRAGESGRALRATITRLSRTIRHLRQYRQLLLFLVAFWIYNDGIGTIMKMAATYGAEIGIANEDLIAAFAISQFVGIPCTFGFGRLARHFGAKRSLLAGLAAYTVIAVAAFFMRTAVGFYCLASAVGMVQGGCQALSRSLFGSMVPKSQAAEFYGFYSTSSKFAGILGPLMFGVVAQLVGSSRLSIVSLVVFFVVGGLLLMRLDENEGMRVAQEEDAAFAAQ